ncbi:hypothetical protein ABBQ38_011326 [Trebouxia sp. C0009 RCD-2024]
MYSCLHTPGLLCKTLTPTHSRFSCGKHGCFGLAKATHPRRFRSCASKSRTQAATKQTEDKNDAESTTEKWGLEAGLFKVFTNKDNDSKKTKGQQAKELITRYGSAYLITSISFAIVSFTLCYALISSGVDVSSLLRRFGLTPSDTSEKVGTFAIAYAAHKALSPVRFPPTVALTPVVAKLIGKKPTDADKPQDL